MHLKLYRILLAAVAAAVSLTALAEIPTGYYNSLIGKKDAELKLAMHNMLRNFTHVSSYSALPSYFQRTDVYPNSSRWWDMYSDIPLYAPSFSGLNREHSFPKSWWGGSTNVEAYIDLNHLYPSERAANTAKSNFPLGMVDMNQPVRFNNGICKVGYPVNGQGGGATSVFEPDDEYKGDFARTYFYMATTYQNLTWKYTYMVSQNAYPTLNAWSIALLMAWHRADPVSQKEIDRNEAVYAIQNNRNPFIDMPELAEYLWGEKVGEAFTPGSIIIPPVGDPQLIAPATGMELDFGKVALGRSVTRRLFVHGADLTNAIEVQLYSGSSASFRLATESIPANLACSDNGYWLNITYTPTSVGMHGSRLLLSGDFEGSRGVGLRGQCEPVPVLTACTATEATDITPSSYTANWTSPENETIDYYIVTRTRYVGAEAFTEELVAEQNWLEITDFDTSDSESYSVQSVYLEERSPMSNVIFVSHSGVTGVEEQQPLVVQSFAGFIRFICSSPQTACRVFDISGRTIVTVDVIEQNTDLELTPGTYLIVTAEHPSPIKVLVY